MLVKICGIRTVEAAKTAAEAGADFLGFNFVPSSKRKVTAKTAKHIISSLHKNPRPGLVGVFMNQPLAYVKKIAKNLKLDYVQLHGGESPKYCGQIKFAKVIKAFGLTANFNLVKTIDKLKDCKANYFLLDRLSRGKGKMLAPLKIKALSGKFPLILAGGLNPGNVLKALKGQNFLKGADVAGGIEIKGIQDNAKIRDFISKVKKTHK